MLDWHGRLSSSDVVLSDILEIVVVLLLRPDCNAVVLRQRPAIVMRQRSAILLRQRSVLLRLCVVVDVVTNALNQRSSRRPLRISAVCVSQVNSYWGRRPREKFACSVGSNSILDLLLSY